MAEIHDYRRTLVAGMLRGGTSEQRVEVTKRGELEIIDFFTSKALEGCAYQVRAGNTDTGQDPGNTLTDSQAQMCVDAGLGVTIIPCAIRLAMLDVANATTLSCYMKAVGAPSTVGTVFLPLPLKQWGPPARSTARVMAAGGVTVPGELATTTVRLWEFLALQTQSATVLAVGALGTIVAQNYKPILRYIGKGPTCVYVQVASTAAFTLHFGVVDYVELLSEDI